MRGKIMCNGNLEDIMGRLKGSLAILRILYANMETSEIYRDAVCGVCGQLEGICRDFQADIDGAEDCRA